jgi:hypothetical protein
METEFSKVAKMGKETGRVKGHRIGERKGEIGDELMKRANREQKFLR